jgi:hypothetical protein
MDGGGEGKAGERGSGARAVNHARALNAPPIARLAMEAIQVSPSGGSTGAGGAAGSGSRPTRTRGAIQFVRSYISTQ